MRQLPSIHARASLDTVDLGALVLGRYDPRDAQRIIGELSRKAAISSPAHGKPQPKSDAELGAMGIKVIRHG